MLVRAYLDEGRISQLALVQFLAAHGLREYLGVCADDHPAEKLPYLEHRSILGSPL